jgi:hypothetical protein
VVVAAALGLVVVLRLGALVNLAVDPDESQHLHAAWLVARAQVPYRDFWEHHPPLFYWLAAPLANGVPEGPGVYLVARAVMGLGAAAGLWLTFGLARRLAPGAAWPAVLSLALLPQFLETTTEVRPDVLALPVWLAALHALVRWRTRGDPRWLGLAGLAQGTGLLLTLKAGFGLAGLAVAVALAPGRSPEGTAAPGRRLAGLGWLLAGVLAPLAAALALLGVQGGHPALQAVAGDMASNFRFLDFGRHWPVGEEGLGFVALALAGMARAVWREGWRGLASHPVHGTLMPALGVLALVLLSPWTPAVYRQAWLPVYPVLAVYAGWSLGLLGAGGRLTVGLAVAAGLVLPAAVSVRAALAERNADTFRVMRLQLLLSCAGEPVLDGTALYVSRPAAYRYGALIKGVRDWIAQGAIAEEEVAADLHRSAARIGYADRRLRALVGPVGDLLSARYVATEDGLLRAGATLEVAGDPAGGRDYVHLLASGLHRLEADAGIAVAIDGQPARRGWLDLASGRHEVTWTGPAGRIRLLAASCAERAEANRLTRRGAAT